jgi:hypothetical protein
MRRPGLPFATLAVAAALMLIAPSLIGCARPPDVFALDAAPPAPDYARAEAWLALPERHGLERSAPEGLAAMTEADAPADVFFIHPTTTSARDVWNAPWDASDEAAPLNPAVLLGQASVFNGCCRIYAPRYRQATLPALSKSQPAVDLAYADIAAAFRQFIALHNDGRPFILASHSQGTLHAIRLLQAEILGTPLQSRLVVAYLIGGYAPDAFPEIGLPICDAPDQTGCVLAWNAAKPGSRLARIVIEDKTYWWRDALKNADQAPAICVNPLTWRAQANDATAASAERNPGSLPLPRAPFPTMAAPLPALTPHLTGARCHNGMLDVDLAADAPAAYGDALTRLAGSYHLNDYGLFYMALRENAVRRVKAWSVR